MIALGFVNINSDDGLFGYHSLCHSMSWSRTVLVNGPSFSSPRSRGLRLRCLPLALLLVVTGCTPIYDIVSSCIRLQHLILEDHGHTRGMKLSGYDGRVITQTSRSRLRCGHGNFVEVLYSTNKTHRFRFNQSRSQPQNCHTAHDT
jgi:hypothetical protein